MRKLFYFSFLILLLNQANAQDKVMNQIVSELCDSLNTAAIPLKEIATVKYRGIYRPIMSKHFADLVEEIKAYNKATSLSEHEYMLLMDHRKQLTCAAFRKVDLNLDLYLENKAALRPLYLKAKTFIYGLEGAQEHTNLEPYLHEKLKNDVTNELLSIAQLEIGKVAYESTLNIMHVADNGQTFRVRYFDSQTNLPLFQIDLIYQDATDQLIDRLEIKLKDQLMQELKAREALNKQIENGDAPAPAPPPPPGKKKGNGNEHPSDCAPLKNTDNSIPAEGTYCFAMAFAEWQGKSMGVELSVTVKGDYVTVTFLSGNLSQTEPGDVIKEGKLTKHKSGVWIIDAKAGDKDLDDIGGCSDGPTVIDFKNSKFLWC